MVRHIWFDGSVGKIGVFRGCCQQFTTEFSSRSSRNLKTAYEGSSALDVVVSLTTTKTFIGRSCTRNVMKMYERLEGIGLKSFLY